MFLTNKVLQAKLFLRTCTKVFQEECNGCKKTECFSNVSQNACEVFKIETIHLSMYCEARITIRTQ